MIAAVSSPKKSPTARKPKKPTLTDIGREAARKAQRDALLAELRAQEWNLTATAKELGLNNGSNVIRSIRALGLDDEYERARQRGDIAPGRPT
jgi:transcriptional regulator with GAF, ATPase, and Fis domain